MRRTAECAKLTDMKNTEYTVNDMKTFLTMMSGMYDLARVVDPVECRILELDDEGNISMSSSCYSIWHADQKCLNCSSFKACRTGANTEKSEFFRGQMYRIHSNPVKIRLEDGTLYEAVVELASVAKDTDGQNAENANDREAENTDNMAIRFMADHDPMTNALKLESFFELSRKKIMENPEVSWVMITGNIREFRLVNELFGELKGNEVLMRTADLLNAVAGETGGLCGRLSGDHFALLLPQIMYNEDLLTDAALKVSKCINNGSYTLSIHFGVYKVEDKELPISVMCDRANMALLTIRDDLRTTAAYFDSSMMRKKLFEQEVISGFDQVLKNGEFTMYLQPLTDVNGRPFGAEALVRWVRSDGTVLPPAYFVDILESAGLITELDMYVWELAVKRLSLWKGTGKDGLTISVNMSAKDFYYVDIYEVLTGLIRKYSVESKKLRLEITETALVEDPEKTADLISRLRRAGFYVEIDDFGKGHSSLSLLKNIHADMLKIDMGFLHETENAERTRIIIGAIISMAEELGMDVLTEGVETKEQLTALSEIGCRYFQGFYFSKPLPAEKFEELYG